MLDRHTHDILLNGTTFSDGVAPIYHVEIMGDGDHQLIGSALLTNGTFLMDHFECGCPCSTLSRVTHANNLAASKIENAYGVGFDLLNAGPTAQNAPAQAVIVDNFDPAITYNRHEFDYSDGIGDYTRGVSYTSTPGYSFDGVAI